MEINYGHYIEKLKSGEEVKFSPKGNSMTPKIKSGQEIIISPNINDLDKGDVVFCKIKGKFFVHLISAVKGKQYQISNNHGHVNGWIKKDKIFGKVVKIGE